MLRSAASSSLKFRSLAILSASLLFGCASASAASIALRIMAGNLTSGNLQSYDLPSVSTGGEGARIFAGLHPDIALVQEFNYGGNSASELRTFVDATFGRGFSYYRESDAQIPNGIVSRYPILAAGEWDDPEVTNRDFAYARIDVPGPVDLWVISVHLLTDDTKHTSEANALLAKINSLVPAGALLAIGGDFNAVDRADNALVKLDAVVETGGPYPVDQKGDADTNASRVKPYDGVYVDGDLGALETNTVIGGAIFGHGAVIDTRVFTDATIGTISPAMRTDSAAAYMQHMAVVRDFALPIPEPATGTFTCLGFFVFAWRRKRTPLAKV